MEAIEIHIVRGEWRGCNVQGALAVGEIVRKMALSVGCG